MAKERRLSDILWSAGLGSAVALLIWLFAPVGDLFMGFIPMFAAVLSFWFFDRRNPEVRPYSEGERIDQAKLDQYHDALVGAGVGAWLWDLKSGEFFCTDNVHKILGQDPKQSSFSAEDFVKTIHLDDKSAFHLALDGVKSGRRRSPLDCRFVKQGGGIVWVEVTMFLVLGPGGKKQIAGALCDVTERKHVEAQLEHSAAYLEAILGNTENVVFSIDSEYRLTLLNNSFVANMRVAFGRRLQIGDNILDAFPEDLSQAWKQRCDLGLNGGSVRFQEEIRAAGQSYSFDVSIKPIRQRKIVTGATVYARNITDQIFRETELRLAKEKAEESDRLKSAFLANMSHEIRTPLNAIMGFTQLLKTENIPEEEERRFVDIILSNGNHLLRIIGDIIDLAQIESNQITVEPVAVDLSALMAEAHSVFHNRVRAETGGKIEIVLENSLPDVDFIECDETRLKQILYNLISNSVKFTEQGEIRIGYARRSADLVEFFVSDTGTGVPEKFRKLIFERFRQGAGHAGRARDGVGLGLSICRGLVTLLGGEMWLESNQPSGTIFRFTIEDLSRGQAGQTAIGESGEIHRPSLLPAQLNLSGKVLIAEDDETNFQVIEEFLRVSNICAIRAENGEEAVRLVESDNAICLVVMDMSMPVLDGLDATRQIKKIRPELPIVAHTAHAMKSEIDRAMEAGCSACLVKPITFDDFKAVLGQVR